MSTGDYEGKEQEYQALRAELHQQIEKKYTEREKQEALDDRHIKTQTKENLNLKQRIYGATEKENQDKDDADNAKKINRQALIEVEKESKKQQADDFAEVKIFEKKWGRLEARELAFGPDDAIVIELRQKKSLADRQERLERDKLQFSIGDEHKLINSKGEYTQIFNNKHRDR